MSDKLGLEAIVYYGAAGSAAATELTIVKDVKPDSSDVAEIDNTRRRATQKSSLPGRETIAYTITIFAETTNAGYTALKNARFNRTLIALYIKNAVGGEGMDGDFMVKSWKRNESGEDAQTIDVGVSLNTDARAATWH